MVGSGIKMLRENRRFTQKDLAKLLGVSRQAVCMWEADKRELKVAVLNRIAKFFGVTVDDIIKLQNEVKKEFAAGKKINRQQKKVQFSFVAPQAKHVAVTGDFVSWDKTGIPMKKNKEGLWKAAVDLKPGRYEYKFIVDGQWQADPANHGTVKNPFGSINSVKEIVNA